MLFNSIDFGIYLFFVFLFYWFVFNKQSVTVRNIFLLAVSYLFYGLWDWRFLSLIIISSLVDFIIGQQLGKTSEKEKRKLLLSTSIVVNIGVLGFFKYYNFFIDSFISSFRLLGYEFSYTPLNIILPVGISFYTFQTLSYVIDIYKGKIESTNKLINFFAFVSFFPQLVAGPIERAKDLLPQFGTNKIFEYGMVRNGLFQIACGLFKKIVIADRIGIFVDRTYENIDTASGLSLLWAAIFFTFQLYLDFSAYSQIARGTANMFGFRLSVNFHNPYLSKSFSEFWSRWHITLSSWMRDYIYIPLGGNRKGTYRTIINVLIVFAVSGLWHGASWNFVIWGIINGLCMVVFDRLFKLEDSEGFKQFISPFFVTLLWGASLIFFRLSTLPDALKVFSKIGFAGDDLSAYGLPMPEFKFAVLLLIGVILTEIISEKYAVKIRDWFWENKTGVRWAVYFAIIFTIIFLGSYGTANDNAFIYFQF